MSELFEKIRDIDQLPIFPLPLVLLPNELLPLHIFEPRYRQLLDDIGGRRGFFGISLIDDENDLVERPEIGSMGCLAEVREVQPLPDGRSNILTIGLIRYRVTGYADSDTPYLIADVEFVEDEAEEIESLNKTADEAFGLFERVAVAAFKMSNSRDKMPEMDRSDPQSLSFLVAAAFNLSNQAKYELLEITNTSERLKKLIVILKQAAEQMESSAEIGQLSRTNGHSKKKLDL